MNNTTIEQVKDKFYSLIVTGEVLPETLVDEWLDTAMGDYSLELNSELMVDPVVGEEGKTFTTHLSSSQKSLLGRYMQREFITRELSRYSKITGIDSKDEKVSGLQATKITLRAELDFCHIAIAELVFKLKGIS